jgi:hypothetical protein
VGTRPSREHLACVRVALQRLTVVALARGRDEERGSVWASEAAAGHLGGGDFHTGEQLTIRTVTLHGTASPERDPQAPVVVDAHTVGHAVFRWDADDDLAAVQPVRRHIEPADCLRRGVDIEQGVAVGRPRQAVEIVTPSSISTD